MSTIPLFLTLLCLTSPDGHLPHRRSDLLDTVVNRLLETGWRHSDPDHDHALPPLLDIARKWAWDAADNDRVSGLSQWADSISTALPPAGLPKTERDRLDAIAPPTSAPRAGTLGRTTRRFIHRVLREHLSAQHVAQLPTPEAAAALLPHMWFDPVWQVSAPFAIAAHNRQHHGLARSGSGAGPRQSRSIGL